MTWLAPGVAVKPVGLAGGMAAIASDESALSPAELVELREWFARLEAEAWDEQFVSDVAAGKLDALAERALADDRAGRSTPL